MERTRNGFSVFVSQFSKNPKKPNNMEKDLEMAAMAISKLSSIEDEMYEHLKECYPNQRPELEDAYWGIVKVRENLQHFITENTPNGLERILGQV